MSPFSIPLPAAVIRRGEIVGIVAGLACFPIEFYAGAFAGILPRGPAALVLPVVVLSAVAGAIAGSIADPAKASHIGSVPLRVGTRAGVIASFIAGPSTVLASTLHSFGFGMSASAETDLNAFVALGGVARTQI